MKIRWMWLAAAVGWMALIFWFSNQPQLFYLADDLLDTLFKKAAHAGAYAVLWLLWWQATSRPALAFALTVGYAINDEWHQTFVPGRNGWWGDVVVDASGAALAWWLSRRFGGHIGGRLRIGRQRLDQDLAE